MTELKKWAKYFYEPYQIKKIVDGKSVPHQNYTYKCKLCEAAGIKGKGVKPITVNVFQSTTSNIRNHIKEKHEEEFQKEEA